MSSLERQLGLTSVVAISISTMLSGVFFLPGLVAAKTGPSVWLAYLVAGACVLPAALSKAELGTAMPTSGGAYVYIDRAFGPLAGTVAGIGLWLSLLLKSSYALVGFSAYLAVLGLTALKPTALALLVLILLLNIRGVLRVSQVQIAVVALAVAALAGLFVAGLFSYESSRMEPLFTEGAGGFVGAVAFVIVAYAGIIKVAAVAEEIRDPDKNVPRGMLISLFLAIVLFVGTNLILVACVPQGELRGDLAPMSTLAGSLSGPTLAVVIAVLGVITMTSVANAGLLAASRFPFAMGRDQLLPAPFERLHPRFRTPALSILATAGLIAAAILTLDVERIAKLASAFLIVLLVGVNITVLVLRETGVQWYQPRYRSPLYPWTQLFGVLTGLVLLVAMGPLALVAVAVVGLPGLVLFRYYGRRRIERRGVVKQRGRRTELLRGEESGAEVAGGRSAEPSGEAGVVVALFGGERSAEMLVELAEALEPGERILVVDLTELPEQTTLRAFQEGPRVASARRRMETMAEVRSLDLQFYSLATRDVARTVAAVTRRANCRWLVTEWGGRRPFAFTFRDPLGWLTDHLPCNLAVSYGAGARYIREVLVHVAPGPHDALAVGTADRLALAHRAALTFVRVIPEDASAAQAQADAAYLDQVRQLVRAPSRAILLRGDDEAEPLISASAAYDLLITIGEPRGSLLRRIRGSGVDRLTERAACSILRLQAPPASKQAILERQQLARPEARDVAAFIHRGCLRAGLPVRSKADLFEEIAAVFAGALPDLAAEEVSRALWERERTQNTGLGDGIGLPHAALPDARETYLGVFTTDVPVDYGAPDERGVDVLFATIGPPGERQVHLELLGRIAGLVAGSDAVNRLRRADRDEELLEVVETRAGLTPEER